MPKRVRRPYRRRKRTYKRRRTYGRRRSLYRGRRIQTPTKPLLLTSRFRKVYATYCVPNFVFDHLNALPGGLYPPITVRMDNIYDPLSFSHLIPGTANFSQMLSTGAPGYIYGPSRGHDVLAKIFQQYRVMSTKVAAVFQEEKGSTHDIGMRWNQWNDGDLSNQDWPNTYYDYLERFGPIRSYDMSNKVGPLHATLFGRQGKVEGFDRKEDQYLRTFATVAQATDSTDFLYLNFYSPSTSDIVGTLTITICYYVICFNPSSQDDAPVTDLP